MCLLRCCGGDGELFLLVLVTLLPRLAFLSVDALDLGTLSTFLEFDLLLCGGGAVDLLRLRLLRSLLAAYLLC